MTAPTKPSVFRIPPPVTALLGSAPPSPSSPHSSLAPSEAQGGSPTSAAIAVTSPSVQASEGSVQSSAQPNSTFRSRRASSLSDLKDLPKTTFPTQATGPRSTYRIPSVMFHGSVLTTSTDSDLPGDSRQPRIFPVAGGHVVQSQFVPAGLEFHSSPAGSIHLSASVPSPSFVLNPTWSAAIAPPSRSRVSSLSSRFVPQLSRSVRPSFAGPSFGIPRTLQGSQYALPLDGEYAPGRRPLAGGKTRSASLFAALVDTAGPSYRGSVYTLGADFDFAAVVDPVTGVPYAHFFSSSTDDPASLPAAGPSNTFSYAARASVTGGAAAAYSRRLTFPGSPTMRASRANLIGPPPRATAPAPDVLRHVPSRSIRSSVINQLYVHYTMFVVLIASANKMGLSAEIRYYTLFLYLNASLYVMQVSRIAQFLHEKSIVPFYLSLVPFGILCVIAREAHMLVTALWYVSFLIVYLQMGRPNMQKHLLGYSLAFLATYVSCVAFMGWFYRDNCQEFFCGQGLRDPITWSHEIVWIVACVVVVECFLTLERFIKHNALTLLERENYVQNLLQTNAELKRELKRMKMDKAGAADLDAPLTKVLQILKDIRDSGETDAETNASLDVILKVLTSGDLFAVDLKDKPNDAEVADFLNNLMQKGGGAIAEPAPANATASVDAGAGAGPSSAGSGPVALGKSPGDGTATTDASGSAQATGIKAPPSLAVSGGAATTTATSVGALANASCGAGPGPGPTPVEIRSYVPKEILAMAPDQMAAIEACLDLLETPDFDVISLNEATRGHPVYFTGLRVFERHNLISKLNLDVRVLQNFLLSVEAGYLATNPYHNALHAADVTASMNYYLTRARLQPAIPTDEVFAALTAALIHDLGHPGFNNQFLINISDRLALQYNDQAVLEHYHCSLAFAIMQSSPSFDLMAGFTHDQCKAIRDMTVNLVLATDMGVHFEFVAKFKNKATAAPAAGSAVNANAASPIAASLGFDLDKRVERKLVLSVAIKCADINNPSKPLHLCTQWTALIMEEFFLQGDEERRRGMEVSVLMDRYNTDIPKCQVGFIDFVVAPLFDAWALFMQEDVKPLKNNIQNNKAYWKAKLEAAAAAAALPPPVPSVAVPSTTAAAPAVPPTRSSSAVASTTQLARPVAPAPATTLSPNNDDQQQPPSQQQEPQRS
ncbi:High affinity cAMP-specific 3',5'-cyclic phosphodiesterase 7A [Allomyces javanicus]|nr:High affinity cAMP-specific 3',5'-cyclic phosphodiesterase 7A [Allomyces javanicus]